MAANGYRFISTLNYCSSEKTQKDVYVLCARLLGLQSILSKESKISDLKGVQWRSPKKPSIWRCTEMKDCAHVGVPKQKGWALK